MRLIIDTVSVGRYLYLHRRARLDYRRYVDYVHSQYKIDAMFAYFGKKPSQNRINFAWMLDKRGFELLYGTWIDAILGAPKQELVITTCDVASKFVLKGVKFHFVFIDPIPELAKLATSTMRLPRNMLISPG